jgi:hypothetical protein
MPAKNGETEVQETARSHIGVHTKPPKAAKKQPLFLSEVANAIQQMTECQLILIENTLREKKRTLQAAHPDKNLFHPRPSEPEQCSQCQEYENVYGWPLNPYTVLRDVRLRSCAWCGANFCDDCYRSPNIKQCQDCQDFACENCSDELQVCSDPDCEDEVCQDCFDTRHGEQHAHASEDES